jgi:hypothetical protein
LQLHPSRPFHMLSYSQREQSYFFFSYEHF